MLGNNHQLKEIKTEPNFECDTNDINDLLESEDEDLHEDNQLEEQRELELLRLAKAKEAEEKRKKKEADEAIEKKRLELERLEIERLEIEKTKAQWKEEFIEHKTEEIVGTLEIDGTFDYAELIKPIMELSRNFELILDIVSHRHYEKMIQSHYEKMIQDEMRTLFEKPLEKIFEENLDEVMESFVHDIVSEILPEEQKKQRKQRAEKELKLKQREQEERQMMEAEKKEREAAEKIRKEKEELAEKKRLENEKLVADQLLEFERKKLAGKNQRFDNFSESKWDELIAEAIAKFLPEIAYSTLEEIDAETQGARAVVANNRLTDFVISYGPLDIVRKFGLSDLPVEIIREIITEEFGKKKVRKEISEAHFWSAVDELFEEWVKPHLKAMHSIEKTRKITENAKKRKSNGEITNRKISSGSGSQILMRKNSDSPGKSPSSKTSKSVLDSLNSSEEISETDFEIPGLDGNIENNSGYETVSSEPPSIPPLPLPDFDLIGSSDPESVFLQEGEVIFFIPF